MASGVPDHDFQVGTSLGHKWKADVKPELNQKINLSMSVGQNEDNWSFEREKDEPLWSFYIFSDAGKKLYLSYDEHNDDITLEFKNDSDHGKKRFFTILVQSNDHYLFRAYHREDRYLGHTGKNGHLKLEKFTTETTLWLIKKDFTLVGTSKQIDKVQVEANNDSKKWISSGAQVNQPVEVQHTSSREEWHLTRDDTGTWMFSPCSNTTLFLSSVNGILEILFEDQSRNSNTRSYHVKMKYSGQKLRYIASDKVSWLCVDPKSHLSQTEEKHAAAWKITTSAISYERSGKILFFPCY